MSNFLAFPLDPSKTALVLIEFQNEFTTPNGKLHGAVAPVMTESNMLEKSAKTVAEARKKGCKIIHVPIQFSEDYRELASTNNYGILANVKNGKAFVKGSWGADFADSMKPNDVDIIVSGKSGLCGFESTNLNFVLRQNNIDNVILAGFLTNCCVESTMRVSYEKGYNVITLTDCTAATSLAEQEAAVKYTFPMFSIPMTHTEFLAKLA